MGNTIYSWLDCSFPNPIPKKKTIIIKKLKAIGIPVYVVDSIAVETKTIDITKKNLDDIIKTLKNDFYEIQCSPGESKHMFIAALHDNFLYYRTLSY